MAGDVGLIATAPALLHCATALSCSQTDDILIYRSGPHQSHQVTISKAAKQAQSVVLLDLYTCDSCKWTTTSFDSAFNIISKTQETLIEKFDLKQRCTGLPEARANKNNLISSIKNPYLYL